MNSKCLLLSGWLLFMVSCTAGIYPYLGRPAADPVVVCPDVQSFAEERAVVISWQADICADDFVLYRRPDIEGAAAELLYRGALLEYIDRDGSNEERYLYSLSKTRGSKTCGPSDEVLGVFSSIVRDFTEPNNSKESAMRLDAVIEANSYYYQDNKLNVLQDEDWYYVQIPGGWGANVIIKQVGLADGNITFFNFSQEGVMAAPATNSRIEVITNYSNTSQNIYFKLTPVQDKFVNDTSRGGGAVVGYKIILKSMDNLLLY